MIIRGPRGTSFALRLRRRIRIGRAVVDGRAARCLSRAQVMMSCTARRRHRDYRSMRHHCIASDPHSALRPAQRSASIRRVAGAASALVLPIIAKVEKRTIIIEDTRTILLDLYRCSY